jgi:hypothetical protein
MPGPWAYVNCRFATPAVQQFKKCPEPCDMGTVEDIGSRIGLLAVRRGGNSGLDGRCHATCTAISFKARRTRDTGTPSRPAIDRSDEPSDRSC